MLYRMMLGNSNLARAPRHGASLLLALGAACLGACTAESSSSADASADHAQTGASSADWRCATSVLADASEGWPASSQVYRWVAPAAGGEFELERSMLSLFVEDHAQARDYAGAEPASAEPGTGTAAQRSSQQAAVDESAGAGLEIAWDDARFEASAASTAGFYAGTLTIAGGEHEAACWRADFEPPYHYDADRGECVSDDGESGRSQLPMIFARETGHGECNDFGTVELSEGFASPVLAGWNLRGADLTRAAAHFASMPDADLAGAQMTGFSIGYFGLSGVGDEHTTFPDLVRRDALDDLHFGDSGVPRSEQPPYYAWRAPCADRPLAAHCVDVTSVED